MQVCAPHRFVHIFTFCYLSPTENVSYSKLLDLLALENWGSEHIRKKAGFVIRSEVCNLRLKGLMFFERSLKNIYNTGDFMSFF